MRFDLVITNGVVVTAHGRARGDVGIRGGTIAAVAAPGQIPADAAPNVMDAAGLVVLPGLIDAHVHLFDPGWREWEDFPAGTKAAAAGGITTIFEMPVSVPPVDSAEVFASRLAAAERRAVVDFAMYGGVGETNPGAAAGMARAGAVAFKTFRACGLASALGTQGGLRCPDRVPCSTGFANQPRWDSRMPCTWNTTRCASTSRRARSSAVGRGLNTTTWAAPSSARSSRPERRSALRARPVRDSISSTCARRRRSPWPPGPGSPDRPSPSRPARSTCCSRART